MIIVHAIKSSAWDNLTNSIYYEGDTLRTQGFIHCSSINDIVEVANYNFKGSKDLILLCIDTEKVTSEIRWEDLGNCGIKFPHIYGALNLASVIDVIKFPSKSDGYFELPDKLISMNV